MKKAWRAAAFALRFYVARAVRHLQKEPPASFFCATMSFGGLLEALVSDETLTHK